MFLKVDPSAAVPVYAQIMDQIKHAVASGLMQQGDRLPSIRDLARDLRVNPNTIIRAYRELEMAGIIDSRRGEGSFVSGAGRALNVRSRRHILAEAVDRMLMEAYHLKLGDDDVLALVRERMGTRKAGSTGKEEEKGHE